MPLRIAHCSDIHLLQLKGTAPWSYLNKRLTGAANLMLKRGRKHDGSVFETLVQQVRALEVDRLVITGDLVNLSLPSEFEHVKLTLQEAGIDVTVIPGNHDTYTQRSARKNLFEFYLGRFMEGERVSGHAYPFIQRYDGDVALIGTSTAIPRPVLDARGRLGPGQLKRLERMLVSLANEARLRVVLIHHPPLEGASKTGHELIDLQEFGDVIRRAGADLVLFGHEHKLIEGRIGDAVVHGITSGTARSQSERYRAAFSVYGLSADGFERTFYAYDGERFVQDGGPSVVGPTGSAPVIPNTG